MLYLRAINFPHKTWGIISKRHKFFIIINLNSLL